MTIFVGVVLGFVGLWYVGQGFLLIGWALVQLIRSLIWRDE